MNSLFRKIIIISIILATAPLLGAGCKGPTAEEQAAVRPVTLNYWTVFDDVAQLRKFAGEYEQIRPYVDIKIRKVRYDEFDDLFVNALADDVGPDMVSMHIRWLGQYQNRLAVMPASVQVANIRVKGEYFKETVVTTEQLAMPTTGGIKANFVGTVYEDVVSGGSIYGMPLAVDTLAIYYNKDLLDKAGIPLAPTTWAEFQEAVKQTTKFNTNGDIIQSGVALGTADNIDNSFDILSLFMMQNDVTMARGSRVVFADDLARLKDGHPTLQALRFYTDFAQPTKEVYSWNSKMENAFDAFVRGKSVFYIGFAYDRSRIQTRAPQMNLEVITLPQLNESSPINIANYWMESVVKKSKHQDLAWDFIRFMATPDKIKEYTEATGQPSPLRSQITEQSEDPLLSPFATQVLNAENWYNGKDIDAAAEAFGDLITGYIEPYSGKDPQIKRDVDLVNRAASIIQQTM